MVSIAIPKNSLSDLINAGLTYRYYANRGEKVKLYLIDEGKKKQFWLNIRKYVDSRDSSLVILDLPLLAEEELKHIDLEPYEYSVLYIPSKSVTVSPESRRVLLEKGIALVPARDVWKCYPGNYSGQIEKRWMEINKVVSLEERLRTEDKRMFKLVRGILKAAEEDPNLAIEKIAKNDEVFFENLGERIIPKFEKMISKPDLELISTEGSGSDLLQIALLDVIRHGKVPLGIKGKERILFLTDSPTFANHVLADWKVKYRFQMKLGKHSAFSTSLLDDVRLGLLLGRLSQRNILLRIGKPELVAERTLSRRLIGGRGPKGRLYRGIRDRFPELEVKNNMLATPRKALEEVISTLKETRTKYEIVT